jgi:beta-glucosidase
LFYKTLIVEGVYIFQMKRLAFLLAMILLPVFLAFNLLTEIGTADSKSNTKPSKQEIERKVEALLSQMTLEEKIGQMTVMTMRRTDDRIASLLKQGKLGSVYGIPEDPEETNQLQKAAIEGSRLKIPLVIGGDVIHGLRTVFPVPLAESSSWNTQMVQRAAEIAARESAAVGLHWTFAPMVDIARDPRWGRIVEGSGEDPFLGSAMAAARVRGFQGTDYSDKSHVIACAKHFAAYGASEAGRDYNSVDMSEKTLREVHLPPFKASVDAGVRTFMAAFNDLNGVPASANSFLLTQILRDEWKFDGFVVSDAGSVKQLIPHGIAADDKEAAREAVMAGIDMEMSSAGSYSLAMVGLVKDGIVPQKIVDNAVRRILRIKFELGLFDKPFVDQNKKSIILSPEHRQAAREMARESIVLLKNDKDLLPLNKNIRKLAVIGPLADDNATPLGPWKGGGKPEDVITVLQGIKKAVPAEMIVTYAKGVDVDSDTTEGIDEAIKVAQESDVIVAVVGETTDLSGEGGSRTSIDLPGRQEDLLKALHKTGKPVVLVLMNGRPLTISWASENIPAILETWFLGVECGHAVADVLFGDYNPSGKLPVTFPRNLGQIPIYYSYKNTGRPCTDPKRRTCSKYLDSPNTPLYPFGYGLSYTKFKYDKLNLNTPKIKATDKIEISVDVENVGTRKGEEVVQLYIQDVVGSMTRPVKELKGFQKITLMPGERKTVRFNIGSDHLSFYNREMKWVVEPGTFIASVGGNSVETINTKFEVISN